MDQLSRLPRLSAKVPSQVRAAPFYGYCKGERVYVKIKMYSPTAVGRAAALLQAGAVRGLDRRNAY